MNIRQILSRVEALIREHHYARARAKLQQAYLLLKEDREDGRLDRSEVRWYNELLERLRRASRLMGKNN